MKNAKNTPVENTSVENTPVEKAVTPVITNTITLDGFFNIKTLSDATNALNAIARAGGNIEKATAWVLRKVATDKLYQSIPKYSKGVSYYAKDKFGIEKSMCSKYVKGARFLISPIKSKFANENGNDFNITQLYTLSYIEDDDKISEWLKDGIIKYSMSVKELKSIVDTALGKKTKTENTENTENAENVEVVKTFDNYIYYYTIVNGIEQKDLTFNVNTFYSFDDIKHTVEKLIHAWNVGTEKSILFTYDIEDNTTKVHIFEKIQNAITNNK